MDPNVLHEKAVAIYSLIHSIPNVVEGDENYYNLIRACVCLTFPEVFSDEGVPDEEVEKRMETVIAEGKTIKQKHLEQGAAEERERLIRNIMQNTGFIREEVLRMMRPVDGETAEE